MLITLMMNLNMFGPTPPPVDGGVSAAPPIIEEQGGRYNKGETQQEKILREAKDWEEIIKRDEEEFVILITQWLINNKN